MYQLSFNPLSHRIFKNFIFVFLMSLFLIYFIPAVASAAVTGDAPGGDLVIGGESYTTIGDHQGANAYKSITVTNGGTLYIQPNDTIDGAVIDVDTTVTLTGNSSIIPLGYYTTSSPSDYNGRGVTINAINIRIDAGSKIDASGQGYAGGAGPGAGGSGYDGAGGSYGGTGGTGRWVSGGTTYGSPANPLDLGSGGGNALYYGAGGNGGCAVKLIVYSTLTNNGSITVAGDSAGGYDAGGGAGGSIWLDVGTLAGNGSISATGGSAYYGGGGAGGRIAVYYGNTDNWTGNVSADGGTGYQAGEVGSIVIQNKNGFSITGFANQTKLDGSPLKTGQSTDEAGVNLSFWMMADAGANTQVFTPEVEVRPVGENFDDNNLILGTNYFVGSQVITSDTLYRATINIPSGLTDGQYHWRANVKNVAGNYSWITYGDNSENEADFEIGGSSTGSSYPDLTLALPQNTVNAQSPFTNYQNSISLSGSYSLTFGKNVSLYTSSGKLNIPTGMSLILGNGSTYSMPTNINGGSLTIGDSTNPSTSSINFDISNFTLNSGSLIVGSNSTIASTTDLTVGATGTATFTIGGNSTLNMPSNKLTIKNNSSIIPKGYYTISTAPDYNGRGVTINATNIQIDSGSKINADGQGYAGGHPFHISGYGPGGGSFDSWTGWGGGGGYGGNGGGNSIAAGGTAYGSLSNPIDLGSGGGSKIYNGHSDGGGAIKLTVSDTLINNGIISANGGGCYSWGYCAAGGSGGSIWIDTSTLQGTGTMTSNGGRAGGWGSGGGAGGRIAIYYGNKTGWSDNVSVAGGGGSQAGEGGTIFWKILDNAAPSITVNSPEQRDYQISEDLTINYLATDDLSGVASTSATLDGQLVENGQTIDLFSLSIGQHNFTVTATDNSGNTATKETVFNTVATPESTITVIEELLSGGEIISSGTATSLISQLSGALSSVDSGNEEAAIGQLNSFINLIEAQSGNKIDSETAALLIQAAQNMIDNL